MVVAGKELVAAAAAENRGKKSTTADNLLDNYMGNMITVALILDERRKWKEQQTKNDEYARVQLYQSIRKQSIKFPLLKKKSR